MSTRLTDIKKGCTLQALTIYKEKLTKLKLGINFNKPLDEQFKALGVDMSDNPDQTVILKRLQAIKNKMPATPPATSDDESKENDPAT